MTDSPDLFSELAAQEQRELRAAGERYWSVVAQHVDSSSSSKPLTEDQKDALRTDLRTLGFSLQQMRADVEALRGLRALATDSDPDPEVVASERSREQKERVKKAAREVADLERALATAKQELQAAKWDSNSALDAIDKAQQQKSNRVRRARDTAANLRARGLPVELLPDLTGLAEAPPPKMVRVRATKECYVGNVLRQPGDVFLAPETQVGGCVVPVDGGEPQAPEPASADGPLPWTTSGYLKKRGVERPAIEGYEPPTVPGLSPAEIARIDKILS